VIHLLVSYVSTASSYKDLHRAHRCQQWQLDLQSTYYHLYHQNNDSRLDLQSTYYHL